MTTEQQPAVKNRGIDIKIIIIGKSQTGKTVYMNKWTNDIFITQYKTTIVSECSFKLLIIDGKIYRIQIFDLAERKDGTIIRIYSKDMHGCVVLADATNRSTLDETIEMINLVNESTKFPDGGNIPFVLVENKVDLLPKSKINNDKHLKSFAKRNGFINQFRVSSKTGLNVDESMMCLIRNIIQRMEKMSNGECNIDKGTADLDTPNRATKKNENVHKCQIF